MSELKKIKTWVEKERINLQKYIDEKGLKINTNLGLFYAKSKGEIINEDKRKKSSDFCS